MGEFMTADHIKSMCSGVKELPPSMDMLLKDCPKMQEKMKLARKLCDNMKPPVIMDGMPPSPPPVIMDGVRTPPATKRPPRSTPKPTEAKPSWELVGFNTQCDTVAGGEKHIKASPGKVANLDACKKSCETSSAC